MKRPIATVTILAAGLAVSAGAGGGLYAGALRYGPPLYHGLRTGDYDFATPLDRPRPRFTAARAGMLQPCNATACDIRFDQGYVTDESDPPADPSAAPPFTGHVPQRLTYRVTNGSESYDMSVAVAYRPSPREDRLGDDVDTTESWEHLAAGVNFAPVAGRAGWALSRYDARLIVTAHDGERVAVDIRQPVAVDEVLCHRGVVLFGPAVHREALAAAVARCQTD
ncbi:MAG: hypothetical protein JF615_04525 [Asticcacaulis sp.]|nr:hypothetical protein [Asticcacaulis sp.]